MKVGDVLIYKGVRLVCVNEPENNCIRCWLHRKVSGRCSSVHGSNTCDFLKWIVADPPNTKIKTWEFKGRIYDE